MNLNIPAVRMETNKKERTRMGYLMQVIRVERKSFHLLSST